LTSQTAAQPSGWLERFARTSIRRPRLVLLAWCALVGTSGLGIVRLEVDNATASFLDRTDPAWQVYQGSLQQFGGDEILVVAIEGETRFDARVLARVRQLSSEFETLPGVGRVDSVSTVPLVWTAPDGSLDFNPAVNDDDVQAHLEGTVRRLEHDRIASESLVSKDGRVFGINLILDEDVDVDRVGVVSKVRSLLANDRAWISGVPTFRTEVNSRTRSELAIFVPVTLLLVGGVVLAAFGSLFAVLVALSTSALGTCVVIGAMGALGAPLSLSTMILPSILLALGCAYVMHVLTAARGVRNRSQLEEAIGNVVRPIGLSGLTTAIGFLAISTIRIDAIRELGTFGSIGVIAVLGAALTAAPAALSLRPLAERGEIVDRWIRGPIRGLVTKWSSRRRTVLAVWGIAVAVCGAGLSRLSIETDIVLWFPIGSEIRDSYNEIRDRLSGITPMNVVIESTDGQLLTQHDRLFAIDALTNALKDMPQVGKAISVADPIRQLHGRFSGDESESLPESDTLIAQYLLILDSLERMTDVVSSDRLMANVMLRINENGSRRLMELAHDIETWWTNHGVPGVDVKTTGIMFEFGRAEEEIAHGQIRGLGLALAVVGLILFLIFRNPGVAIVTLVPNAVPIVIAYGCMGFARVPLDAATVCLGSLALGIAVDDTIHLATRFRDHRVAGLSPLEALDSALRSVLPALLFTTAGIALGFAALVFSEFTLVRNLGVVTAFLVLLCLLADLTLLPALLLGRVDRDTRVGAHGDRSAPGDRD